MEPIHRVCLMSNFASMSALLPVRGVCGASWLVLNILTGERFATATYLRAVIRATSSSVTE